MPFDSPLVLVLTLFLTACTAAPVGDDTAGLSSSLGPTTDSGTTGPVIPDLPVTGCGLDAYDWVSLDQVGQIVSVEEAPELSYGVDTINGILKMVDLGELTPVPYGVRAWRVRYTTQDKGQLIQATGYLALPDVDVPTTVPVMLWNHPTTGFTDICAPTNMGITGGAYALLMAANGFAVAAPDYLGMAGFGDPSGVLHPWVVPEPTAIVALDSVRALLNFLADPDSGGASNVIADPSRTVIFGASEGGFASLWADRYQPAYLPQIQVTGVIAAIPATDPLALATIGTTTTSATTAAISAALSSMADWHDTKQPLSQVLQSPFDQTVPQAMATTCDGWDDVFQAASAPDQIFAADFVAVASAGGDWAADYLPWSCYLHEGTLRDSTIPYQSGAPVLIVTGEDDQLAWPEPTHADIPVLCEQGYTIEHIYCAGQDHTGAAVAALPKMMSWAVAAGQGKDPTAGATTCQVSAPVDCTKLR
ncbi:MAG: hypothetical protein GXP62_16405 [Oligoflexia bacterium]|nr:hypothetical protein [Oligoflexia bacterium]